MPVGTPGESCSGCSSPIPRSRSARSPRRRTPASRSRSVHPHLTPLADRVLADTSAETLGGPRRRLPRPAARPLGGHRRRAARGRRRHRLRRRLPARRRRRHGRRSTTPRMPGPGPTACPSSSGRTGRSARRWSAPGASPCPGCYPTAVSPRPGPRPGRRRRPARRHHRRRRLRHERRRQVPQATPARCRGDGRDVAVRRRWACTGIPRRSSRTSPRRRCRTGHRLLHPDPRPDAAGHPRDGDGQGGPRGDRRVGPRGLGATPTPTSPSSTSCPRAPGRRRRSVLGSNSVHHPGRPRRAGRAGRRGRRRRQPHQGHRRGRRPVPQPRARAARDDRVCPWRGWRREPDAAAPHDPPGGGSRRPARPRRGARLGLDAGSARLADPHRRRDLGRLPRRPRPRRPVARARSGPSRSPGRSSSG